METSYTYEDFLALPTVSLKDYLSLRGLSITGKKVELVAKAYSAQELKIPVKIVRWAADQYYKDRISESPVQSQVILNGWMTQPNGHQLT